MKQRNQAFTFVELIVVLVIIAILATIGFVSYESYLSTGRDTAKISLLKDIHTSFRTYSLNARIPLPENKVDISASGSIFAYQGDFTQKTATSLGFTGNPYDDSLDIYPSYMILKNRKDTQVLHYLEDKQSFQQALVTDSFANTDYQILYPKVIGKPLGIMIESETKQPLHLLSSVSASGSFDVVNGTGSIRAYYSQNEYYEEKLSRIIPDQSCKRILELGGSKGDGIYTINIDGNQKIQVYCDMRTDGGGWTFVSYIDTHSTAQNIFNTNIGSYQISRKDSDISDNNSSYSIDSTKFNHNEMMITIDNANPIQAKSEGKFIIFSYPADEPGFYSGPLPCSIDKNAQYKLQIGSSYQTSTSYTCNTVDWRFYNSTGIMLRYYNGRGAYWYNGMGGDNTGYHASWVYVR